MVRQIQLSDSEDDDSVSQPSAELHSTQQNTTAITNGASAPPRKNEDDEATDPNLSDSSDDDSFGASSESVSAQELESDKDVPLVRIGK